MSYNPKKAAQTIAYFIKKSGADRMWLIKAVKLVYLADRQHIQATGFPIQDEDRYSLKHGPVNSSTYNQIQGVVEDDADWSAYIQDGPNHVVELSDPQVSEDDLDELSDAEVATLDAIWERFGGVDRWELVKWTHDKANLPEWEDPGQSSSLIPLERIMMAVGIKEPAAQAELANDLKRAGSYL